MNRNIPQYLYTVTAVYTDCAERMKMRKPFMIFTQFVSENARKANKLAREYAESGMYCSVEVKNSKNNRTMKIL